MKTTLLGLALYTCAASLYAATPPGESQPLTSPDQVPEGLAKSDWHSIRAAYEAGRHAIHAVDGGWQARNPGQQWTTRFDGRGFLAQPKNADWQWGFEFKSYGFGDRQTEVGGTPVVRNDGQRLSYQWDDSVQEWFVNDTRGLEHGFTITQRPATDEGISSSQTPLSFTLATRGSLLPSVSPDAQTVHFRDASHAPVLTYAGLKVWDADGKILPSRFEAAGENQVRLLVEESGARYPLMIDPIAQQAYLKAGNNGPSTSHAFGHSVSVSGETVVVGAPSENSGTTGVNSPPDETAVGAGAAYVFVKTGTTWSQQAYIKASNSDIYDGFGWAVAVSGETLVVGARWEDSSTTGINSTPDNSASDSGAAYVFVRNGTAWSQQAFLKPSNTGGGDHFGYSVSVSADTLVIGAILEDSGTLGVNSIADDTSADAGAAYIYVRTGTEWSERAYLKASNTSVNDRFGSSVTVSGNTVVVGAPKEDSSTTGVNSTFNDIATDAGAAYVFELNGTSWTQQAYLKPANTGSTDEFGCSLSLSGDTLVVGAHSEDSNTTGVNGSSNESGDGSGAAYVFVRLGTIWSQQAFLKPSNTGTGDGFGYSVSVLGDHVVVGAHLEDGGTTGVNTAPNEGATDSGAAYVFIRNDSIWTQQAYVKSSNTGADDRFGSSVSIGNSHLLIGAIREDSNTIGINGASNDQSSNSGASYLLERSGSSWTQGAFIKASNTPLFVGSSDNFGTSVAASGDTVVVGAPMEDGGSSGVNSTSNESATNSGAAYVFVRNGASWTQQAYLKASNVGADDRFGTSLSISGDTLVVGAGNEDSSTTGINSAPNENASNAGAGYVFVRSGTTWGQQAYLKASNTGSSDLFGSSVAVSGDTVVVGAVNEDSSTTGVNSTPNDGATNPGAAYVFLRTGTTWSQQAYLKASNTSSGDNFGFTVAVSVNTVVVGSPYEDSSTTGIDGTPNESALDSGAAYVFARSGTVWNQQAYLKASNTGASDSFGISVAVSGDTVAVGAPSEDSSTRGVNSTPNESASGAGASYVFVINGGIWSQQAYLKASNTAVHPYSFYYGFGRSVSVAGDIVAIGAPYESSTADGILNSVQHEDYAGAAYVFVRIGSVWNEQEYLKASNAGANDEFGKAVSVAGDSVIVGAPFEDSQATGANGGALEGSTNSGAAYLFNGFGPLNVTTPTSSGVSATAATLGGDVVSDGGASITERGVVLSATATNTNPVIGGAGVTKVTATGTTGVFTASVSGLSPGTGYSFKAYATNSSGTAYTSVSTFNTLNNNVNLSGLVLSSGTLSPVFASGTTAYTASVPNATTSLTVTPTVASATASVRVNNAAVSSGTASGPISLNVGGNVITTVVTAQDGTTKTYTVSVTRVGPPTVTTPTSGGITAIAANLGGNVTSDNGAAITERGVVYSITATNSNPLIAGTGVSKVMGTGTTGVFIVGVSGLTNSTGYSFKAYAISTAGTSYTTVATFTTLSNNANLSNLVLSGGALSPVFASATTSYTTSVPNTITSLTVTPTSASALATIRVNGVAVASGTASGALSLNVGSNTISTVVTAQDGTTRTYTVTVTRAAAPPTVTTPTSAAIVATTATLGGNVTADGGTAITERGVIYSATATNSNPAIGGTGVTKVTGTGTTGVFTVNVSGLTNGTGYSFKAYAINSAGTSYTPAETFTTLNSNNTLSNLVLSSGTLSPTFTGATTSYTASVPNGTTSVTVTPTVANSASTVKVNNVTVASGAASGAVSLNIGSNTITTVVTAQDGTTRTYTVTVTRLGPPTVTTPTSASIATTSATLGGNVTSDNGAAIVERGVVYSLSSTNSDPSIGGTGVTKLTVTGTTGVFTLNVSGLSAAKNHTFKAYATNSVGTSYSSVATFLTLTPGPPVFTQATSATTVAGRAFEFQLQATNGPNTFTCSNLPPWLNLNAATGWLSGTPPAAGNFNLALTANNGFNTGTSSLAITVTSPPPTITSSLSDEGRQNEDYRYTITAVGTPTSFSTGVLPSGLNFNTTTGVISGIPTVSGTFNIALGATNAGGTTNATLVLRVLPPIPPPVITSPSFASGTANAPFSFQLAASNTPQSYAIQSGPAWLSVSPATGLLSGTPTVPGTATVQVRASNATGAGAWAMLSISISPNPSAPVITSLVEARGRRNDSFSFQVTSSPPATSYVLAGTLPTGIVFSSSTGLFSGTPTVEGTVNLTLTASNTSGQSVPTPLRIVLGPSRQVPVVTSATSFVATTGVAFSTTIIASNSPTSFTFTGLPPGLAQVGTTGLFIGTPTTPGSFNFTVRATNADGSGPIQNGVVTVRYHANAPRITASTVSTGYVGVPFSHPLLSDKPATSFAVVGGTSLPAGLTLGASSGLIGGTPTASGSFSVTLQASNASGAGEPRSIVITIAPKPDTPEIIGSLLEETLALASYSYTVQTKSLLPILSHSITGLPDGLNANPTTGRISGAATVAGVFEVKLKASNSVGVGAEKVMRLKVRAGHLVPKVTSSASVSVVQGTPFFFQIAATNAPILGWEAAPLPDGLSLNPSTGIISGKPVVAGTYQSILRASNVNGASDPLTLQIQVKPQVAVPVMVSQSYFSIIKSQPISVELQATNLPTIRPWPSGTGIFAEGLPEGMSLNAATGVLSGEPSSTDGFTRVSYYDSYSSWLGRRYYLVYTPWYSKSIALYAANESGRGPIRNGMIQFKPSDTTVPPVITGPKQLSWTSGQPLNFKITTNMAATRYELQIPGWDTSEQTGSEFSLSGSHAPLPGRNTYRLGAYNGSWGQLDGLPLTVAPAAGAPRITSSSTMTATAGVPVSATLAASGSPTRYEITAMSPAWPVGLSFNPTTGALSGTVTQSGAISFLARAYNAVGASLPKEITLFVSPPPGSPVITTGASIASRSALGMQSMKTMSAPPAPLSGKVGEAFSHQFEASGSVIRFTVTGLPEGLVYNENTGEVAGEPTRPGLFDLVVTPIGTTVSGQPATVSLRIDAADGTPEMTNPSSASAVAGTAFSWQFSATENPAGYDLAELPDWLVFNALTGSLSGTPEGPGESTLNISAFNASGQGNAQQFTIVIAAAAGTPVVTPPTGNFAGQAGLAFNAGVSGAGEGSFYDATALPFGISLDSETGIFSGMPVEPGTHEARIWGVNAQGTGESIPVTFVISPASGTPLLVGEPVLRLIEGQPFAHTFSTVPNATAFAVEGLPTGWSFDPVSGSLQGTPLSGTYPLTLEAWNEVGGSGGHAFQVRVFANPGDLWSDEKFGEQASDPAISGWLADPDGDGVVNLLERAFNLSPVQAATTLLSADTGITGLPLIRATQGPSGPGLAIQYLRRKASTHSGLTYTPQLSSSLDGSGGWSAAMGTETVEFIDAEWERVTLEEDAGGHPKRFGRVQVTESP